MSDSEHDSVENSGSSDEFNSDLEDVTQEERETIRDKISTLSFEDLMKMKEEMGSKIYNETIYGSKPAKGSKIKRANKNRPREISSKIRITQKKKVLSSNQPKRIIARDPRFDPLCGTFDRDIFKNNYKFLGEIRTKEVAKLKEELKTTTDPERQKNIKYLIQRMDNQIREQNKREEEKLRKREESRELREKMKKGEKVFFKSKSLQKVESLIHKYEDLKKTNKLQKHIEKKSKKLAAKEKKRQPKV